jgi:hypothetical protein
MLARVWIDRLARLQLFVDLILWGSLGGRLLSWAAARCKQSEGTSQKGKVLDHP